MLDHEERIVELECKDQKREVKEGKDEVRFESLCKRLDDLIAAIKWFAGALIGVSAVWAAILQARGGL